MHSIYLKITNRCNIRCPHCFISNYSGDMPTGIVHAVNKKFPQGKIVFHGGEPTLMGKEYIKEVINILGERQYILQSNLMFDVIDWVDLLKKHFYSSIGTSIDKGRLSVWDIFLNNTKLLSKAGINVTATVTVTADVTPEQIYECIRQFIEHGGNGFYIQVADPIKTLPVKMDVYKKIYKELYTHPLNKTAKRLYESVRLPACFSAVNGGNCAKHGVRTIDPDGAVYVCPDFAGQKIFPLGNILSADFDDSSANPNNDIFYKRERNLILKCNEGCWGLCRGGCAAFTYFNGLDAVSEPDPFCSLYREMSIYACAD
jgi:radical SAM protein with 4Fe4S-binding SPASM domain